MAHPEKLSFTQDTTETSPGKREAVGALRIAADGRKFRYSKNGPFPLRAADAVTESGSKAARSNQNLVAGSGSLGDRVVSVFSSEEGIAENAYEDGYLQVVFGPGEGNQYRILANTGCPAGKETVLTLAEPLRANIEATSLATFIPSPWCGVVSVHGDGGRIVGVSPCDVPSGHYFFAQTGGVACVRTTKGFCPDRLGAITVETLKLAVVGDDIRPCLLGID